MRNIALITTALLFMAKAAASAEPIDSLIGEWVSPDGQAKQSIERQFDGTWLSTRMWFQSENGWKLVATGAMYRKPNTEHWISISRTTDMDGIELFESTLSTTDDGHFSVHNLAFTSDGSLIKTEEAWQFDGTDRYNYTIYRIEGTERRPWFEGSWVRTVE